MGKRFITTFDTGGESFTRQSIQEAETLLR